MKRSIALLLVLPFLMAAAPAKPAKPAKPASTTAPKESLRPATPELIETIDRVEVNWTKRTIHVTGLGFAPERGNLSQRRALAKRDAFQIAYQGIAEALDQIRVTGDASVRDLLVGDDLLKARLRELVREASPSEPKFLADGSVEVALNLPLNRLSASVLPPMKPSEAVAGAVTGIVVDGRGTGAQPSLRPRLKGQNGKVLAETSVSYFHSPEAAKEAMGKNPLMLKAKLSSGATRSDLVLDEGALKQLNPHLGTLQTGHWVIIL